MSEAALFAEPARPERRATRLADDFAMPQEWLEAGYAARHRHSLPMLDLGLQAEMFANYWQAKSGAGARKTDWRKTWINWCLNARGRAISGTAPYGIAANGGGNGSTGSRILAALSLTRPQRAADRDHN